MSNHVCRACLAVVGSNHYNLLENASAYMFWFCTSIQVLENEAISKSICANCYDLLVKFAEFKQKCIDSQYTLLQTKTLKKETGSNQLFNTNTEPERLCYENSYSCKKENEIDCETNSENIFKYEITIDYPDNKYSSDSDQKPNLNKIQQNETNDMEEKHYCCEICKKTFDKKSKYRNHKRTHSAVRFPCSSCDKIYQNKQGLKIHWENNHLKTSLNDAQCRLCGKLFKNKESRKVHEKRHEENKSNIPHICHVCGKSFKCKSYLQVHLETHLSKHSYSCDKCNRKFNTKGYLQTHVLRTHTESAKKYICDLCNAGYKYKSSLVKHINTHEGKKLYHCDECNKSFSTQAYHVIHKRLHSGERPFSCSYCPKAFVCKRHLNDHHRIHTGEKRHKCILCNQHFTQRGTLMRHIKTHNKINV